MGATQSILDTQGSPRKEVLDAYHANPEFYEKLIVQCRENHNNLLKKQSEETLMAGSSLKQQTMASPSSSSKVGGGIGTSGKTTDTSSLTPASTFSPISFSEVICTEINLLRKNPHGYIIYLEAFLKTFRDEMVYQPKCVEHGIRTKEGRRQVKETIAFLKNFNGLLPPCKTSTLLEKAAAYHCEDLYKNNMVGHDSSNGLKMKDRIELFGVWRGTIGENIDFTNGGEIDCAGTVPGGGDPAGKVMSQQEAARWTIINLLVDDGVPDRGHRRNLMDKNFRVVGAALGPHKTYRYCCVMDFAGEIIDKSMILTEQVGVTFKSLQDMEAYPPLESLFRSIPHSKQKDKELRENIKSELVAGKEVTIHFMPQKCNVEITYKDSAGKKISKIHWKKT